MTQERGSWMCWGVDSLYSRRKPLLMCAFVVNLAAIACITGACIAIGTTPALSTIGWASATTTLTHLEQCDSGMSIQITVWLGLRGFYGQCNGQMDGIWQSRNGGSHFCDTTSRNNWTAGSLCTQELNCVLVTVGDPETLQYCSACEDTSNDCVGTLVTAAAFGIFPLVLTIRRFYSVKPERGLRLRTLFFSSLAFCLGLHAFIRFHLECATTSSFAALVCSHVCNNGYPSLVPVPTNFVLYTGGKLVIIAACLKCLYFAIHLVTPVAKNQTFQENIMGEDKSLLPRNEPRVLYGARTL